MGENPRGTSGPGRSRDTAGSGAQRGQIAAARIVAYDIRERTPDDRAAMLRRIGLTRIVWDWREEHALRFDAELDAMRRHGIDMAGLWCPMPLADASAPDADVALGVVDPHVRAQVEQLRRRGMRPDLWTCVEFGLEGTPARVAPRIQRARVQRVADHLEPLTRLARDADMCVALTNHLGWFGEPENQVEVIEELSARGLRNVGIAYQFQHGHHQVERFAQMFAVMQPHLVALALSGMDADAVQTGRTILPWGAGRLDRKLAHLVMASGWDGLIAVQGHSADDVEPRLLDSIEGIEWMLDRWRGVRHDRPVPRIATPAWPEPALVAGPSLGMSLISRRLRRRLVEAGQMAPTLTRVRTAPPEPRPITLPPRQVDDTAEIDSTVARSGAARARRARGGAATALAAIHAARLHLAAAAADVGDHLPDPAARTQVADASGPHHPLAPVKDAPTPGITYAPMAAGDSGELPLRIARRETTLEAPDPYSGAIHALLTHLEHVGFRGAPRSFGWDATGRHLVEWIDGMRADHRDAPSGALDPARIGSFMRDMHDALETFEPPADAQWFDGLPGPGGELIIHQDIAPSNVVIAQDGRLVAIDWDAASPGTRLWDVAHAVHAFAPLRGIGFELSSQAERLRAFADGYGLSDAERERLLPLLALRSERMYHYLAQMRTTGESPWLEMWERGAGSVWASDAQWIRDHEHDWRAALLG